MDNTLIRYGIPFIEVNWSTWCTLVQKMNLQYNCINPRVYAGILCDDGTVVEDNTGVESIRYTEDKVGIDSILDSDEPRLLRFDFDTNPIISLTLFKKSTYFVSIRIVEKDRAKRWNLMKQIIETIQD